jgi:hypothetical protein
MAHGEFSLYWWDPEDYCHEEMRFVDAETAMKRAANLARGPASLLGIVKRIIITDGGDCTNFEWKHGEGIVFPPQQLKDPEICQMHGKTLPCPTCLYIAGSAS